MFLILILVLFFSSPCQAKEPSVREVQEAAIRTMGFDHQEMDRWKSQSRWSAALPRLQAGFQRDLKDVVRLTTQDSISITSGDVVVGPRSNNFLQDFNQGTSFDVKAVWFLNELVFNRDSLAASHERRDWVRERSRTLQEVTTAYFTRIRLKEELKKRRDPISVREKKKILLDQASATLDAFTGGWFSEETQRGNHK